MSDPRDPYTQDPRAVRKPVIEDNRGTSWIWIAGGVAAALVILALLFGNRTEQTAVTPPATQTETTGATPTAPTTPASPPAAERAPTPPPAETPAAPPASPPAATPEPAKPQQ